MSIVRRLNHIRRYSSYPVNRQQNVSEHTFWVMLYGYRISEKLKSMGEKVNVKELLEKGLFHDFEESVTGDIVRTMKYDNPQITKEIKKAEEKLIKRVLDDLFGNCDTLSIWHNAKDKSLEGQIVAVSDFLCVFEYCLEEIKSGNDFMLDVLNSAILNFTDFAVTIKNKNLRKLCISYAKLIKKHNIELAEKVFRC